MFKKTVYLEIGENYLKHYRRSSKGLPLSLLFKRGSAVKEEVFNWEDMRNIDKVISKNKVCFIYEGEEFYIKSLKLPVVGAGVMENMIRNELNHLFRNMDCLTYAYDIYKRNKREIELLVYCINSDKNKRLKALGENANIKAVFLIQLCILKTIQRKVVRESFAVVIMYNNTLYILACSGKKVLANAVLKNYSGSTTDAIDKLEYVQNRFRDIEKNKSALSAVYFVNFKYKDIIKELSELYPCNDLGDALIDQVLKELC
jgi:hypothetical protein